LSDIEIVFRTNGLFFKYKIILYNTTLKLIIIDKIIYYFICDNEIKY